MGNNRPQAQSQIEVAGNGRLINQLIVMNATLQSDNDGEVGESYVHR